MSQIIQIQDINSSDTIKTMVEKINYNFDQIMTFGGGPQGEKGDKGELGPDGEQGERGNLITVVDDISTVGSDLKVGDIAIYSDNQYIYEVKENSDGNLFFEKTNICIKGNKGESGKTGTSDSPFKYDETHDVIITAEYNGKIPSHTFIGTDTTIKGRIGNLNVVGSDGIHIFKYTDDTGSDNGYCGKIYGGELNSENILVLRGEDNPDNYVKIDNTLLTDKIHSSDNTIKIAEITTNNEIVLGDSSNNASIECNEFTVKNGSNTSIRTSSSNIWLKGNLFVNTSDYTHTTKIYGSSIDINTNDSTLCVSTHIQANKDCAIMSHVESDASANVKTSAYVKTSKNEGVIIEHKDVVNNKYSSISISSNDGIKIDASKVIIGKDLQSNTQIKGDATVNGNATVSEYATAKVNDVSDVYLGCPIGTVVMWAGEKVPVGWLLCNGSYIGIERTTNPSENHIVEYSYANRAVGGRIFSETEYGVLQTLVNIITDKYGKKTTGGGIYSGVALPNLQRKFPLGAKADGTIGRKPNSSEGWSTKIGSTGGEDNVALEPKHIASHKHGVPDTTTNSESGWGYVQVNGKGPNNSIKTYGDIYNNVGDKVTSAGNNGTGHNNIPPFIAINFIIKYK